MSELEISLGYAMGEICNRNGCNGILDAHASEGSCSCHYNPPCSHCTTPREYCPVCGWDALEELREEEANRGPTEPYEWKPKTLADLDRTKIDWISKSHTHFSMIKEGVFPPGTSKAEVASEVRGTFGGRFERFDEMGCTFRYIAYTN